MKSQSVSTKQQRIAELAVKHPQLSFTSLAYHIDAEWLREAYRSTRRNAAVGVDLMTAEEYEKGLNSRLENIPTGSWQRNECSLSMNPLSF